MNNKKTFLVLLVLVFALVFTLSACNGDAVTISSLTLNKKEVTLEVGETFTIDVTLDKKLGEDETLTWSSSNKEVISIEMDETATSCVITALAVGTSTVTVSYSKDLEASVTVTVIDSASGGGDSDVAVSAISVTGDAVVGATLTANPTPSNATSVTYQWQANTGEESAFENIEGATSKTFVISETLAGNKIQVVAKGVSSSTATSAPVGPVKALSTAEITLDGEDAHSNTIYGNTVSLGEDLKVTGTLKYHETDPTGMGFADYDHHFLVFKIAGLPEAGAEVTIKGLADEVESSTTYTFTSASDVVIWGVEANENIEITVNYGGEYAPMVYKLDLSGVTLAEKEVAKSIATIDKATLPTEDAFAWANGFDKSNWSGLTVTGSLDYVDEATSVGFTGETHFLTFAVEAPAELTDLNAATVSITGKRGQEAVINNYTGGQFEAYNDGQALLVVWGVEDGEDEITIVVDWDGDSKDYNATTYILDLKDLVRSPAPVFNGTKGYSTIQAAITAATAGDTIKVAAGTYNEALSIDKDLTLQGAIEAILTGGTTITAGDVTIEGFTISNKGILASGITGLTLEKNTFNEIRTAMDGSPGGSVIGLDVTSASGSIEINNNEFSNIGKENDTGTAIRMVSLSGKTTITNNEIKDVTKNGINIYRYPDNGVNLTITGNTITNWDSNQDSEEIGGRAIRIDFNSKTGLATINNNTLTPPEYNEDFTPVDSEYVKITRSTNITKDFEWPSDSTEGKLLVN